MAGYPYYSQAFTPTFGAYGGGYNAPIMQQAPSPVTATPQPQPANNGVIWVQGESGAKSYIIAPNTTVLLMDSESNRFYLKSSDASGMPQPLRIFEYSEIAKNAPNLNGDAKTDAGKEYALKSDLDALRKDFDALMAAKADKRTSNE
ncbi:MAG: hypothetical protein IKU30_06065 [Clostridia bacterium]|nr:hypothetical protein [Clostridia bacterium]